MVNASQCCPFLYFVVLKVRVRVRINNEWCEHNAMTFSVIIIRRKNVCKTMVV